MTIRTRALLLFTTISFGIMATHARAPEDSVVHNKNLITKILDYFSNANKPKSDKAFDISFIGGPHYSADAGFGLGLMGMGIYNGNDSLIPPSSVSIYTDVTTNLWLKVGVEGTHIFRRRVASELRCQLPVHTHSILGHRLRRRLKQCQRVGLQISEIGNTRRLDRKGGEECIYGPIGSI